MGPRATSGRPTGLIVGDLRVNPLALVAMSLTEGRVMCWFLAQQKLGSRKKFSNFGSASQQIRSAVVCLLFCGFSFFLTRLLLAASLNCHLCEC